MRRFSNTRRRHIPSAVRDDRKRSRRWFCISHPTTPHGSQAPPIPLTVVVLKPAPVNSSCRGGPPWPPVVRTSIICDKRAATEGRPYSCWYTAAPMSTPLPTIVIRPTPRISAIRLVLAIFAGMIALFLGLLVLLLIGIETGPIALLLGLLAATIPVPIYVALVLWIDRYEAEPLWMLTTAFFWGALFATFFAFLFNTGSAGIVSYLSNAKAGEAFAAVISAPIVEETGKAFILFIFFFWKKDEFDGVIDGIVYASLAALGFAMTENILYYGRAALGGGEVLTLTLIMRGFFAPFSHPLFTSLTGIGLGLARQSTNIVVKIVTPIVGLLMAIFMHSMWNGSAVFGGGAVFVLTYLLVMIPAFLIMLVVIAFALR